MSAVVTKSITAIAAVGRVINLNSTVDKRNLLYLPKCQGHLGAREISLPRCSTNGAQIMRR
jgi:hypothetical protein